MSYEERTYTFDIIEDEVTTENVSQLNMILEGLVQLEIVKLNNRTTLLRLEVDKDLQTKKSRNAGRKVQHPQKMYTYKEVHELMQKHTNDEVAKILGYSRATFYRRLKNLKSMNDLSDMENHYFI